MHLIVFNYSMDSRSQVFAHQRLIVGRLSSSFDSTTVVCSNSEFQPPSGNYRIYTSNWKDGKDFRNVLNFYRVALPILFRNRKAVLFSHMTEVQSFLVAPLCHILGIKHYLWYAHTNYPFRLKLAFPFLSGLLTSTAGSCPILHPKVKYLGQSVDGDISREVSLPDNEIYNSFYHVGRLDPSKQIDTIIEIAERLKNEVSSLTLDLYGAPSSAVTATFAHELISRFSTPTYQDWLTFHGQIMKDELVQYSLNHQVFLHAFQGSLDKSLIEATMLKRYVITCNREYLRAFKVNFDSNKSDRELIFMQLKHMFELSFDKRNEEIMRRFHIAQSDHSLNKWLAKLVKMLQEDQKKHV